MKKVFSFIFIFFPFLAFCKEDSVVETINKSVNGAISEFVYEKVVPFIFYSFEVGENSIPLVLVWLIVGALFFTIYFKFINFRGFKYAINLVRGRYDDVLGQGIHM